MQCNLKVLSLAALGVLLTVVACRSQLEGAELEGAQLDEASARAAGNAASEPAGNPAGHHAVGSHAVGSAVAPVVAAPTIAVPPIVWAFDPVAAMALPQPATGSVHVGRLISIYGLAADSDKPTLYASNVFVAPRWRAHIGSDGELLPCNPDSMQKRILIRAPIASPAFEQVVRRMVAPALVLQGSMPRNAALRITFADEAAAERAIVAGTIQLSVTGVANAYRVQLLAAGRSVLVLPGVAGTDAMLLGGDDQRSLPAAKMSLRIATTRTAVDAAQDVANDDAVRCEFEASGWLPDAEPLRIVGSMDVWLERVGKVRSGRRMLTLFMGDVQHALDRGDMLRIHHPETKLPIVALEVLEDVVSPAGQPKRVHVRVHATLGERDEDWLESIDPSNRADFPHDSDVTRRAFLRQHAPKVTIRALYEPQEGDHASNFVRVSSQVVHDTDGNRKNIAPDANYELQFSQPVDCATLRHVQLVTFAKELVVPHRAFERTESTFSFAPPLGLPVNAATRAAIRNRQQDPARAWRPNFVLEVAAGESGVRSVGGSPLPEEFSFGFSLNPAAPDNMVGWRVF